jgi:hypothetical protein
MVKLRVSDHCEGVARSRGASRRRYCAPRQDVGGEMVGRRPICCGAWRRGHSAGRDRRLCGEQRTAGRSRPSVRAAAAEAAAALGTSPEAVEQRAARAPTARHTAPVKGIVHVPAYNTPMKPGSRETLLIAVAKARNWVKDIERGRSFAEIAAREGKAERHFRSLARLAFRCCSPRSRQAGPAWARAAASPPARRAP